MSSKIDAFISEVRARSVFAAAAASAVGDASGIGGLYKMSDRTMTGNGAEAEPIDPLPACVFPNDALCDRD
jgi:hypothetical protein